MKQYFVDIFRSIWTVLIGMKITFRHLFTPAVTIQYPDVKLKLPERARNRLYVNMDDCIGCLQCEMACPVDCITIETIKAQPTEDLGTTSTGQKKRLYVPVFDIDIAKCCYCGLCVYPCPTECITMTDVYEFSEYERRNLVYNFATLTEEEVKGIKERAAAAEKEAAAKKAASVAAAKAAVPAGAAVKPGAPSAANAAVTPKTAAPSPAGTKKEPNAGPAPESSTEKSS